MKDDKGRVIYVGKSASLRDRVASYFQASTKLEHKKSGLLDRSSTSRSSRPTARSRRCSPRTGSSRTSSRGTTPAARRQDVPYLMITTGEIPRRVHHPPAADAAA
jgi:hypothetical protein